MTIHTLLTDPREFISIPLAVKYTQMDRRALRKLCRERCVDHYRKPGDRAHWMVRRPSLIDWMRNNGRITP